MTGEFARVASALVANGYRPVPILPGQKQPALKNWPVYSFSERDLERFPVEGCGLLTGPNPAIDIDIRNPQIAERIEKLARERFGEATPIRIGESPKRALLLRCEKPFRKLSTRWFRLKDDSVQAAPHRVEILSQGQQIVAYGIHPVTKAPYRWRDAEPLTMPCSDLPKIDREGARAFLQIVEISLTDGGNIEWVVRPPTESRGSPLTKPDSREGVPDSLERLRAALEHLDPDDRDLWLKIGWAVARETRCSQAGFDLWMEWSQRSAKHDLTRDPIEMKREYFERSIEDREHPATLSGVFALARSAGWREGVSLTDFLAYAPTRQYIYMWTCRFWSVEAVNSHLKHESRTPAAWLDANRAVHEITWLPGAPRVVEGKLPAEGGWLDKPGARTFNLYRPPKTVTGDARAAGKWRDHLARIYPDHVEHIELWLAHRLQRPGEKINHALVLGGVQGIGKDSLLEPIKTGVGPWNWAEISPSQMLARFNGWLKSTVVRVSEVRDLGDVNRFAFYEHSKSFLAAPPDVLRCDEKHLQEYPVFNVAGYIFTTNHKTSGLYLPPDDRRHFVAWSEMRRGDFAEDYWSQYWAWLRSGGTDAVVDYLSRLDLHNFDAKAPPEKTEAWWAIVQTNEDPEGSDLLRVLKEMGGPAAVVLEQVVDRAQALGEDDLAATLRDRRQRRRLSYLMERAEYELVRNPSNGEGRWTVWGRDRNIYARKGQERRQQLDAARNLAASQPPVWFSPRTS